MIEFHTGNNVDILKTFADNTFDSIVTDPPYELGFMNKHWDSSGIAYNVDMWKECLRVLKPGGHLAAFGGSRTYHRMACAIEDAGFEIRDQIMWVYGCLSEDTEILTLKGWMRIDEDIMTSSVLCYNIDNNSFVFQKPLNYFNYANEHTAYRIKSDKTDQIVSRNHRVIVERSGKLVFQKAETLKCEENIPILETLFDLPQSIYDTQSHTSIKKQDLLARLCEQNTGETKKKRNYSFNRYVVPCLREGISNTKKQAVKILFKQVQRKDSWHRIDEKQIRQNRNEVSWNGIDREQQSGVEGWSNILQKTRKLFANKICSLPERVHTNGKKRRVYNGTQAYNGSTCRKSAVTIRSCSSYKPQPTRQQAGELNAIQDKQRPQIVRSTITPIEYKGRVWCVEVETGAFVARRNGKIFVTGNSGFPKSLNISKALDKMAGVEREVVGYKRAGIQGKPFEESYPESSKKVAIETPATDSAKQWNGFGTALKPAHEPICVARKPLIGTVAENILQYGTGGLNIDGCRVDFKDKSDYEESTKKNQHEDFGTKPMENNTVYGDYSMIKPKNYQPSGRFPANLIHDGSEEVVKCFPETKSGKLNADCYKKDRNNSSMFAGDGIFDHNGYDTNSGSASRFFKTCQFSEEELSMIYCAKASPAERNEGCGGLDEKQIAHNTGNNHFIAPLGRETKTRNNHPTVKPVSLMQYLCRLITPPKGTILDPFSGSGTTGIAAIKEGFNAVLIDQNDDYITISKHRVAHAQKQTENHISQLQLSL